MSSLKDAEKSSVTATYYVLNLLLLCEIHIQRFKSIYLSFIHFSLFVWEQLSKYSIKTAGPLTAVILLEVTIGRLKFTFAFHQSVFE